MNAAAALANIKAHLLRHPAQIDAHKAGVQILARQLNCSTEAARLRLADLKGSNVIHRLFKRVLPKEFAKAYRKPGDLTHQFFDILGFPINEDWFQQLVIYERQDPEAYPIPIYSFNPDLFEHTYDFQDMIPSFQLGMLFYRFKDQGFGPNAEEETEYWTHLVEKHGLAKELRPTGYVESRRLVDVFKKQRSPLKHFEIVLRIIDYNTGCFFYDFYHEMELDLPWSRDNILFLRKEFKRAQQIQTNSETLDKWLKEDPKERFAAALNLYQRAKGPNAKPKNKK